MYLSLIFLPLFSSILSGLFGRKLGVKGSLYLSTFLIFITTLFAIIAFNQIALNENSLNITLTPWLISENIQIDFGFLFDSLSVSMLLPVLMVSSLVHLYSISYMEYDPHQQRFFSYLSLFTFFMVILVTANNLLLLFVGWEGVGICSYLLINFWYTRIQANKSAISALLINRVGDMFLTLGLFTVIWTFGNLDFATIFSFSYLINSNIIIIISLLFLLGAMAKSAQLGLHVWLPNSMEGPTPVSALIHAATMVTAGVYLLMRCSPLLEYSSIVLIIILWVGALTCIFAATTGFFQNDIKRIIAYSTCSQLGMLFIAIGLSQYNIALFHLVNHAYFKALLFLGAGSIIHSMNDEQDIRKYGGLIKILPFSYSIILIGSLSLMAIPFLTGYYSKDLIIESTYGQFSPGGGWVISGFIIYWLSAISALFTTLYSIKIIYWTFLSKPNSSLNTYVNAHESSLFMTIPLFILALFSIFFGYLTKDIFIGIGSTLFNNSLFIHPDHSIIVETEFSLPVIYKLLPVILTLLGSILSLIMYNFYPKFLTNLTNSNLFYKIYGFFNNRYYFDLLQNNAIHLKSLSFGYANNKFIDRGLLEIIGPNGLSSNLSIISKVFNTLDSKKLMNFALTILISNIAFIILYLIGNSNLFFIFLIALSFLFLINNNFIPSNK